MKSAKSSAGPYAKLCARSIVSTLLLLVFLGPQLVNGSEFQQFRIGTGGSAGTYFPIGRLIARALSPDTTTTDATSDESSDPRPDLILLAQRSNGSEANVREISEGLLESGFVQADVAHWAYHGTGPFTEQKRLENIRTIATLYLESVHLLARTGSGIRSVDDLAGKRVSVDEIGSGTQLDVGSILKAFNLTEADVDAVYLKTADAIDRLSEHQLDAFFIIAGYPVSGVTELLANGTATLVPINGPGVETILQDRPFYTQNLIPSGTYANTAAIPTLAVAAQWLVERDLDEELVYQLTKSLWTEQTRALLVEGHPKGQEVRIESALLGISVPLHTGAARYYREAGLELPDVPAKAVLTR